MNSSNSTLACFHLLLLFTFNCLCLVHYSQTGKTMNARNISGMLLCCKEKANQAWENQTARKNIRHCAFVARSFVLIFAVVGHNTINIPEIFQCSRFCQFDCNSLLTENNEYFNKCPASNKHPTWSRAHSQGPIIGCFWVPKTFTFKMRPSAQPFLWKWVLFLWEWKIIFISKAEHLTSFCYRGPGELGNGLFNKHPGHLIDIK